MTKEKVLEAVLEASLRSRRERMLSVRLSTDEHARLFLVATEQGVPAATLARLLIVHGLDDLQGSKKEGGSRRR